MKKQNKQTKMNACKFIFPIPVKCVLGKDKVKITADLKLDTEQVPAKNLQSIKRLLKRSSISVSEKSKSLLQCEISDAFFKDIADKAIRKQAYKLEITKNKQIILQAADIEGLRYGIVTLSEMFAAVAKGTELTSCRITDYPAMDVRGVQIDMAREFFPPMKYLKKIVDRLAKMKANTLWLYIENRFHAEGMEDISPANGMTAKMAEEISKYARERGIDIVPGINVLSHMEGWFRLQRNSEFCDGNIRSYPVLTNPKALKMVLQYIDSLIDAFPSKNFHAGLDELLFTETNPEAAKAVKKLGKAQYFANFAKKIIKHIQKKGKTVWMWDDMVLGKNIYRKEGFNDNYKQALDQIPNDVIMTHWYYWTNEDGKHTDIIKRITQSNRPFIVAPSSLGFRYDYSDFNKVTELQSYMTECGLKHGAFGLINTHWESRYGHFFESHWPHLSVAAGFAWSGSSVHKHKSFAKAFTFNLTQNTNTSFVEYLNIMSKITEFLNKCGTGGNKSRNDLYLYGAQAVWRGCSPMLSIADRKKMRKMLDSANDIIDAIDCHDKDFKASLKVPLSFFHEIFNIIDGFDNAYNNYHKASLAEKGNDPKAFKDALALCYEFLHEVINSVANIAENAQFMQKTGHTPYDAYALKEHCKALQSIEQLIRQCVKQKLSLPYFEKLLYLPQSYFQSNIKQLEIQNTFHNPFSGRSYKWLKNKKEISSS